MSLDPAFLFYTSDFLVGTMLMKYDQKGKYITLLCLQHQKGMLTEEDMIDICGTYDKDIFKKFKQTNDGLFYNERLEKEVNKRKSYSKSRSDNRLSKKTEISKTTYVNHMNKHMSDISKTHDRHMENTISSSISTSNTEDNKKNNNNIHVSDISSTYVEDMSKICTEFDHYQGNWHLENTVNNCLQYFLKHNDFQQDRNYVFEKIKYVLMDLPDDELWERIEKWAQLFNERNEAKHPKRAMRGHDSWVQHFRNWFVNQDLQKSAKTKNGIIKKITTKSAADLLAERGGA